MRAGSSGWPVPETVEQRVDQLEQQLKDREKITAWVSVAGTVLVPLAIGGAGLLVSRALAAREQEIARINAKVQQVDVASKLFEALVSEDGRKRRLAVKR
jgi:hypothetical protein